MILATLVKIPHDKLLHFFYGSLLALFFLPFGWLLALLGVAIIAVAKEMFDAAYDGTVEIMDVVWTLFGASVVLAPVIYEAYK